MRRSMIGVIGLTVLGLAGLGCGFTIRRPDELRQSVRALGERLARSA